MDKLRVVKRSAGKRGAGGAFSRSLEPPWGCYWTAEQVRSMDAQAIAEGTSAVELMQRAGLSAWRQLQKCWPTVQRVCIWLGSGNNAGDGLVLARWAKHAGVVVELNQVVQPCYTDAAAIVLAQAQSLGLQLRLWSADQEDMEDQEVVPLDAMHTVQVDALLGTGVRGSLGAAYLAAIHAINAAADPVLALDIPTGIHPDTGCLIGTDAVLADVTVSFVAAKRGLYTGVGAHHAGVVLVDTLDVVPSLNVQHQCGVRDMMPIVWPKRRVDAHKGNYGHVLIVGGQQGMSGAAVLAARSAARAGAGWVSVASQKDTVRALLTVCPEVMGHSIDLEDGGEKVLANLLEGASVVVVGPGLGRSTWSQRLFTQVVRCGKPLVLDADALYWWKDQAFPLVQSIITPHPGEAAMLLDSSAAQIQADRFQAAQQLVQKTAGVVVLKGNGTLVAAPNRAQVLCRAGNPAMASAGMGDTLAGIIAGLWAQHPDAFAAACQGVYGHAHTADCLVAQGWMNVLATDVLKAWSVQQ